MEDVPDECLLEIPQGIDTCNATTKRREMRHERNAEKGKEMPFWTVYLVPC